MKLALIVPGGVDPGGERRVIPVLLALIRRLAARHELHVFALRQQPLPATWTLQGARVRNVGGAHPGLGCIGAIVREHRVAPFDLVQSFFGGSAGLAAVVAARRLGRPSVVHVAGGELAALPEIGYGGRLGWRGRLLEPFILRRASAVTTASAPMVAALATLGIHARRIPFGVDLDTWPCREPRPWSGAAPPRLLHVGSLNRVKDQSTLLAAFAALRTRFPAATLDIAGEDTLQGRIQREAAALTPDGAVRFHGFLTQAELRPLYEAAQLLMVTSRHEAGPIVALEAALAGVPTVGTNVGLLAEWAPRAARVAAVGDSAALATEAAALLDDESTRLAVARAAQAQAVAESADFTAQAFETLYATLPAPRP